MEALRKMKDKELQQELALKREELRKFRFDITGTKITNIKEGRNLRKEIAQILTEIRNRELATK